MKFFTDGLGKNSSMRLMNLLWCSGVLGTWILVSIKQGTLASIPPEVVMMCLGGMTVQYAQKKSELDAGKDKNV